MNKHPKSLNNSDLKKLMVESVKKKIDSRMRYFGENYHQAKVKVQQETCAGVAVWSVIDEMYTETRLQTFVNSELQKIREFSDFATDDIDKESRAILGAGLTNGAIVRPCWLVIRENIGLLLLSDIENSNSFYHLDV